MDSVLLISPDFVRRNSEVDLNVAEKHIVPAIVAAQNMQLSRKKQGFIAMTSKLDAMSPLKVLTRGYSMAQNDRGEVVRSVSQVELGERIGISFSDGKVYATVMDKKENG